MCLLFFAALPCPFVCHVQNLDDKRTHSCRDNYRRHNSLHLRMDALRHTTMRYSIVRNHRGTDLRLYQLDIGM